MPQKKKKKKKLTQGSLIVGHKVLTNIHHYCPQIKESRFAIFYFFPFLWLGTLFFTLNEKNQTPLKSKFTLLDCRYMLGTGSPTSVLQNYLNDLWEHRVLGLPQSFKLGGLGLVLLNGGAHFENHWWSAPHRSYISVALIIMTAFDSIFLLWKHRVYSITVPHNSARLYSGQMLPPFYGWDSRGDVTASDPFFAVEQMSGRPSTVRGSTLTETAHPGQAPR